MHAFLLVGNNSEKIQKEIEARIRQWKISSWDITRVAQEGTVGIEAVRDFQRELALTPRASPAKAGILTDIDRFTPEAQNALLKTIEEPPPLTYIIATTGTPEAILPTIRSRMSPVNVATSPAEPAQSMTLLLQKLLTESPGKRLQLVEPYTGTRDDAKQFVGTMLAAAHQELSAHPSRKLTELIRNLLTAQSQLSVNVNQKMVVDNAVLSIP